MRRLGGLSRSIQYHKIKQTTCFLSKQRYDIIHHTEMEKEALWMPRIKCKNKEVKR